MAQSDVIVVFGVPGTGKSVLGSRLARILGYRFTTLSWIVLFNGYWREYDRERRSFIVDYDSLLEGLRNLGNDYIVETHWLEPFLEALRPRAIVFTRTHPLRLYERLLRRNWPSRKIAENVEAELLGVLVPEALEAIRSGVPVLEIDTSNKPVQKLADEIAKCIKSGCTAPCCIDWLSSLSREEVDRILRIVEIGRSRK